MSALPPRPPRSIDHVLFSKALGRDVRISIILPPYYRLAMMQRYPLVVLNDGQDFPELKLLDRLSNYYRGSRATSRIIVGIHANERRMREYGTADIPDYVGRGDLAAEHSRFVTTELLPWLKSRLRISRRREDVALGGFSLGGLSAFDIAWRNAHHFGSVGCFSASFWWRSAPMRLEAPDADRVAVDQIMATERLPDLNFYFMAGDHEEESDRNGNGIIDVIDDTQDVIAALHAKGISDERIAYQLVEGGEHNQTTWGPAVIDWLKWLDSKKACR